LGYDRYSDTSWMISSSDSKSTSGWIFSLGRDAISWAFKKQKSIFYSTMKSEFIIMAAAGKKKTEWLINMMFNIKLWTQPMSSIFLYYDNEATMSWAYSNIYNGKSRHINIKHRYIREFIINELIIIVYVKSINNLVNSLIKWLSRDIVWKITNGMCLKFVIKDTDNRNPTLNQQ